MDYSFCRSINLQFSFQESRVSSHAENKKLKVRRRNKEPRYYFSSLFVFLLKAYKSIRVRVCEFWFYKKAVVVFALVYIMTNKQIIKVHFFLFFQKIFFFFKLTIFKSSKISKINCSLKKIFFYLFCSLTITLKK